MLPVETLTDAVSFLPLNGLDSVLLASRQLSSIATKCVDGIEIWVFEFFYVALYASKDKEALMAFGDSLTYVDGWDNIVDVLDIALHNSRFGNLRLSVSSNDVIPLPNKSALEVEVLDLCMNGVASADLIIDVIASFRKIQVRRRRLSAPLIAS